MARSKAKKGKSKGTPSTSATPPPESEVVEEAGEEEEEEVVEADVANVLAVCQAVVAAVEDEEDVPLSQPSLPTGAQLEPLSGTRALFSAASHDETGAHATPPSSPRAPRNSVSERDPLAALRAENEELRVELAAFRESVGELCAQAAAGEEALAAAQEAGRAAASRLARAEAALERERSGREAALAQAASERAAADTLRRDLAARDAAGDALAAAAGGAAAELARLRAEVGAGAAQEEAVTASAEVAAAMTASRMEAETRAAAAEALCARLAADNDALTELLNQQAGLLAAIREARLSAASRLPEETSPQRSEDASTDAVAPTAADVPKAATVVSEESAQSRPRRGLFGALWAHISGYDESPTQKWAEE